MRELSGTHDGHGLRIGIVSARFNEVITARLLRGALTALYEHSVSLGDIDVARVRAPSKSPRWQGQWPSRAIRRRHLPWGDHPRRDGPLCHIANIAARGVADAAAETGVPVIFGILTTNTVDQALDRSGGQDGGR